jgi:long-chain acyl-CoA synthetase
LFENLSSHANSPALISKKKTITYSELQESSLSVVSNIESKKIVFLICQNSTTTITFYVGLIRNLNPTFLLPENLGEEKLHELIRVYSPDYVVSPHAIQVESLDYKKIENNVNFIYKHAQNIQNQTTCKTAIFLTTSGSTGSVKYAKISRLNLESNTHSISKALGITSQQITITTMPMHYSYGLSVINTSLESGGSLVVTKEPVTSKTFWGLVKDHRVNTLSGVPYIYEQLSRISTSFLKDTCITKFTQAGGRLNQQLKMHFAAICKTLEIEFFVMYGQTEATARISILPAREFDTYGDSIGYAIPNGKLTLYDESGLEILAPMTIGEIGYSGPNVFGGYVSNRDDLWLDAETSEVLMTGDLGYFDRENRYYISGRKNRIAKILGHRINLDEIEEHLSSKGLKIVCVQKESKLHVLVEYQDYNPEIEKFLVEYLNINRTLLSLIPLREIPRLSNGKIDYVEIERILEAN